MHRRHAGDVLKCDVLDENSQAALFGPGNRHLERRECQYSAGASTRPLLEPVRPTGVGGDERRMPEGVGAGDRELLLVRHTVLRGRQASRRDDVAWAGGGPPVVLRFPFRCEGEWSEVTSVPSDGYCGDVTRGTDLGTLWLPANFAAPSVALAAA